MTPSNRPHRSAGEQRDWAEIPVDILTQIYRKLGAIDVLRRAQAVCRPWRRLSLDPYFWRIIDMRGHSDLSRLIDMEKPTRLAVDRSAGHLEELYLQDFGSDRLLTYIAQMSTALRILSLVSTFDISNDGLAEFVSRCPSLHEIEISNSIFQNEAYMKVGQARPELKCFRLNESWWNYHGPSFDPADNGYSWAAIEVAASMPQLSELHLISKWMDNEGLHAILDSCLQLEFLDILGCTGVRLDAGLREKLAKIKNVRLPDGCWLRAGMEGGMVSEDFFSARSYLDDDDYYTRVLFSAMKINGILLTMTK